VKRNDPVFLAWCAGFFDGEGTVGVYRHAPAKWYTYKGQRRPRKTQPRTEWILRLAVYQNHVRPLRLIREEFGGSLFYRASTKVWFLVMAGKRASELARAILPYSVVKREELTTAIEFAELRHVAGGAWAEPKRQAKLAATLVLLKRKDPREAAL